MSWKTKLMDLLISGNSVGNYVDDISEDMVAEALELLKRGAQEDPYLFMETIATGKVVSLTFTALAILFGNASESFLCQPEAKERLVSILVVFDALQLYNFTKMLKSKNYGRGLGSYSQKLIRRTMHLWHVNDLKSFTISQPRAVYGLLRLIHPSFKNEKAEVVGLILKHKSI